MRYIDADKLIDDSGVAICVGCEYEYKNCENCWISDVKNADTVYAIDVVRCCDCKHWIYDVPTGERICDVFWFTAKDCDYCSHAERRKDEQIH